MRDFIESVHRDYCETRKENREEAIAAKKEVCANLFFFLDLNQLFLFTLNLFIQQCVGEKCKAKNKRC